MATTSQVRDWYAAYRCSLDLYGLVAFPGDGRVWNLPVAKPAIPAFERFAAIMHETGYLFRETAGGTYNCRQIAGTTSWSIHAYALAIDLNPSQNPFGSPLRHNYPAAFITQIEAVRTGNGKQVFQWGGRWTTPDAMHWQINCSPADLATGLQGDTMAWTKPGDPVADKADCKAVHLYQGEKILRAVDVEGLWDQDRTAILTASRLTSEMMVLDQRLRAEEAEKPTTGTVDQVARDAAAKANIALSKIKAVI